MGDSAQKTSTWAIASFCCALGGLLALGGLMIASVAIAGIVFGHIAVREIRVNTPISGSGLARAGLVIGYAVVVLLVIELVFGVAMFVSFFPLLELFLQ